MTRTEVKARQYKLFPGVSTDCAYRGPVLTLPEICLEIRHALSGASDPWPADLVRDTLALLKEVDATWAESDNAIDVDIDAAVLSLVRATIEYIERRLAY